MEAFSGYARGLISIVVISAFLELLVPKGGIKKFVSFASGVIIVVMTVQPLLHIDRIDLPSFDTAASVSYSGVSVAEAFEKRLAANVEQALGVTGVKITVSADDPGEILYVKAAQKKAEIAEYLGIPINKVGD